MEQLAATPAIEYIASTTTTPAHPSLKEPTLSSSFRLLPAPILLLTLQYVSLSTKLTQLTHLSAHFPVLQPAAFALDGVELTSSGLAAWRRSDQLRRLLSSVSAVVVRESTQRTSDTSPNVLSLLAASSSPSAGSTATSSMASLRSFQAVRSLLLEQLGCDLLPVELVVLIVGAMPQLHSLRLHFSMWFYPCARHPAVIARRLSFWCPLIGLRELRRLTIAQGRLAQVHMQLEYSAFRFLCSLPLTHLDLATIHILPSADSALDAPAVQPPVTGTWQLLRLFQNRFASAPPVYTMQALADHCARAATTQRSARVAAPEICGLRYTSLDVRFWPDSCTLASLCSTLVSLELHNNVGNSFSPLSLLDPTDSSRPLLPHLRHLSISNEERRSRHGLGQAEDRTVAMAELLYCYRLQLRRIALTVDIGSSSWPLLQAVFACSQLRRCTLLLHDRAYVDRRSDTSLPLFPLPHLHTLELSLPLSKSELRGVLLACPALLALELSQVCELDPLQCMRLVARHASSTLRSLHVKTLMLKAEWSKASSSGCDAHAITASPPSAPSTFPSLRALKIDGTIPKWSGPPLMRLVQLLRHAPLRHLHVFHLPLQQQHHLAPLRHLRSLLTAASLKSLHPHFAILASPMPPDCQRYFRLCTRLPASSESGCRLYGEAAELRRRLMVGLIDDEEAEVSDEALDAGAEVGHALAAKAECRHVFVQERLFEGRDGREAYMDALQRLYAEKPENVCPSNC